MIDELAQTYAHYVALRRELSLWVEQSIRRDGPDQNQGGEDEANFALAFFPHYLISGDERVAVRFRSLANDLKAWVRAECLHGYEAEAEAHHGTEPFLLFLPRYLGLFPNDRQAAALLDDVAHHIGNWVEGVPAWYDWTRDVFLSYWIGTRTVGGAHGGREHADMGGAICSVAAGHGRNWGCGAVTGCYGPLLMGTREIQGAVVPLVEWAEGHLPEQILALLQPPVGGPGTVVFYNGSEERQALEWRMAGAADWQRIELAPSEVREYPLETKGVRWGTP